MYNYVVLPEDKIEFFSVADVQDLPPGERLFIEINDKSIVVFNIANTYYAIANICSHDDGPLGEGDLDAIEVICPRHGARFDIRNGKVRSLPAVMDIPAYPVRVIDGEIQVGLPREE